MKRASLPHKIPGAVATLFFGNAFLKYVVDELHRRRIPWPFVPQHWDVTGMEDGTDGFSLCFGTVRIRWIDGKWEPA